MPELPDIELYLSALRPRIVGQSLQRVRIVSPFFVRTFDPPITALEHQRVVALRRMGKRLVWSVGTDLFAVFHLMIAGRFRWTPPGAPVPGKVGLAAFDFDEGTLIVTEAGSRKQASLHVVRGEDAVAALDPGGLEVFGLTAAEFAHALRLENHTLKRALTDPHLFSGIGNAYSDEILHAAQLSPLKLTQSMTTRRSACCWTRRARSSQLDRTARARDGRRFPEKVTAFRPEMAVHGRYGKPCPRCGSPVQRIVYARNESNYCPTCQTNGRLLADRALSRLLRDDWPRTLEDLERSRNR